MICYAKQLDSSDSKELKQMDLKPIRATGPGNVELDLVDAGILPGPFFGNNIQLLKTPRRPRVVVQ